MKYAILSFLFLFFSCNNPQQIIQENDPIFHTTDPSRLFFQNTRSHLYKMITQKTTKIDHYYLKSLDEKQLFYPVIANNWLSEEAYLLLKSKEDIAFPWRIRWQEGAQYESMELNSKDRKTQYEFCQAIYKHLKANQLLSIQDTKGNWLPFWQGDQARQMFETILRDYFRLTEKI